MDALQNATLFIKALQENAVACKWSSNWENTHTFGGGKVGLSVRVVFDPARLGGFYEIRGLKQPGYCWARCVQCYSAEQAAEVLAEHAPADEMAQYVIFNTEREIREVGLKLARLERVRKKMRCMALVVSATDMWDTANRGNSYLIQVRRHGALSAIHGVGL